MGTSAGALIQLEEYHLAPDADYDFQYQEGLGLVSGFDMGGEESMIDEHTTSIFIESALFSQVQIRRTSIRLNLITEAAQRFTKGLEPLSQKKAMDRSVQLLSKYADGSGYEETITVGNPVYKPLAVKETLTHCNALLGTSFTMAQIQDVMQSADSRVDTACRMPFFRA